MSGPMPNSPGARWSWCALLTVLLIVPAVPAQAWTTDGPTFDPDYQWVHPPPDAVATNTIPIPTTIVLTPRRAQTTAQTGDHQLVLRWDRAALRDRDIVASMTALDPATLPPLPSGIEPVGNAYRVDTRTLENKPARLGLSAVLVTPAAADATFGLAPGSTQWRRLGPTGAGVAIDAPLTIVSTTPQRTDESTSPLGPVAIALGAVTVVAAIALVGARRWRRRRPRPAIEDVGFDET